MKKMEKKTYIAPRQEVVVVNSAVPVCDIQVINASGGQQCGKSRLDEDEVDLDSDYGTLW